MPSKEYITENTEEVFEKAKDVLNQKLEELGLTPEAEKLQEVYSELCVSYSLIKKGNERHKDTIFPELIQKIESDFGLSIGS